MQGKFQQSQDEKILLRPQSTQCRTVTLARFSGAQQLMTGRGTVLYYTCTYVSSLAAKSSDRQPSFVLAFPPLPFPPRSHQFLCLLARATIFFLSLSQAHITKRRRLRTLVNCSNNINHTAGDRDLLSHYPLHVYKLEDLTATVPNQHSGPKSLIHRTHRPENPSRETYL